MRRTRGSTCARPSRIAAGRFAPPVTTSSSRAKASGSRRAASVSACTTAGTATTRVTPASRTRPATANGSNASATCTLPPVARHSITAYSVRLYETGPGASVTTPGSGSRCALDTATFSRYWWRVFRNAFGRLVVPEENRSRNASSPGRAAGGGAGWARRSRSSNSSRVRIVPPQSRSASAAARSAESETISPIPVASTTPTRCSSGHRGSIVAETARKPARDATKRAAANAESTLIALIGMPPVSGAGRGAAPGSGAAPGASPVRAASGACSACSSSTTANVRRDCSTSAA